MSFEIEDAKRTACPLLIGLVGASFSGKTVSALRLASGIVRVTKKPIVFIDTESRRSTHYADRFQFKAMHFTPPFGALRYLEAIKKAVEYGAGCIIVDSMTHEHSGEGGMLWQSDQLLERYESERDRNANLARSFIKPKRERARLVNGIVQLGATCPIIFCFRAAEKLDFKHKVNNQPRDMGWQPETTSPLMYEMTQQFLLTPGCEGVPILTSSIPDEKRIIKSPSQFQGWFRDGEQLSEDIGERFARWAFAGQEVPTPAVMGYEAARTSLAACTTIAELKAAWTTAHKQRAGLTDDELSLLEAFKDEKKESLTNDRH
jgi:hypothetical protein